jgi:hypothetical protein
MEKTFTLKSDYIGLSGGYLEEFRYFKGVNELIFDLSEVHNDFNPIVNLTIDFNDGSEIFTKTYNFKYPQKIVDPIVNTFYPYNYTQHIIYYPTFYIKYLNGINFVYQCPIKIAKNSFFGEFCNIDVSGVQFVDDIDNSLFTTLQTRKGDILNIKIK